MEGDGEPGMIAGGGGRLVKVSEVTESVKAEVDKR